MIGVEIKKQYSDDSSETNVLKFKNTKELYKYFLATTLESAREEMTKNEFTILCLDVCGFILEYFT